MRPFYHRERKRYIALESEARSRNLGLFDESHQIELGGGRRLRLLALDVRTARHAASARAAQLAGGAKAGEAIDEDQAVLVASGDEGA